MISHLAEVDEEAVIGGVLHAEGLAPPRAAPHGLAGGAAAVEPARDPGAAAAAAHDSLTAR